MSEKLSVRKSIINDKARWNYSSGFIYHEKVNYYLDAIKPFLVE